MSLSRPRRPASAANAHAVRPTAQKEDAAEGVGRVVADQSSRSPKSTLRRSCPRRRSIGSQDGARGDRKGQSHSLSHKGEALSGALDRRLGGLLPRLRRPGNRGGCQDCVVGCTWNKSPTTPQSCFSLHGSPRAASCPSRQPQAGSGRPADPTPSSAKRCCQRHTIGRLMPTCLAISSTGRTLGRQQDDLRPLNMLLRTPSVVDDPLQVRAMLSREEKRDSLSHSRRLARLCAPVNPPFASLH